MWRASDLTWIVLFWTAGAVLALKKVNGMKMSSFKTVAAAAVVATLSTGAASAATYDFVALANAGEMGVADGTMLTTSGGSVLVAGYNGPTDGSTLVDTSPFAYLDSDGGSGPAGLGVCQVITGAAQCNPSSDDNVTAGPGGSEILQVNFGAGVISGLTFNADNHGPMSGAFDYSIDGGATWATGVSTAGSWAGALTVTDGKGIMLAFAGTEFYLASADYVGSTAQNAPTPAPLPAGGVLLLTALGGMAVARKRAKKA
jgi:hypothetical protein